MTKKIIEYFRTHQRAQDILAMLVILVEVFVFEWWIVWFCL